MTTAARKFSSSLQLQWSNTQGRVKYSSHPMTDCLRNKRYRPPRKPWPEFSITKIGTVKTTIYILNNTHLTTLVTFIQYNDFRSMHTEVCKEYKRINIMNINKTPPIRLSTTRTTRTHAFWDTHHCHMITHTSDSHQIPSQNKTKS